MKNVRLAMIMVLFLFGATTIAWSQDLKPERVNVPLTNPTRPVMLKIGLISGSITVKASAVKEITVEARMRKTESNEDEDDDGKKSERPKGLKLIPNTSSGLTVEEDDNVVNVSTGMMGGSRTIDLTVTVPTNCSMNLSTVNDGNIEVYNAVGDLEINNVNGHVTLSGISGSAVAHSLNEDLVASFVKLNPQKPMSFSSMNGKIDVTLPADTKASLIMKSDQGQIYSDFDIKTLTEDIAPAKVEENKGKKGKFRVTVEKSVRATINGGGQEFQFTNFNGDIYIRKGK
jgi:hypothetical protein